MNNMHFSTPCEHSDLKSMSADQQIPFVQSE